MNKSHDMDVVQSSSSIGRKSKKGLVGTTRLGKLICGNETSTESDYNFKEADEVDKAMFGSNGRYLVIEDTNKQGKMVLVLPPTSMDDHAVDDFIEVIEMEEKIEVMEADNAYRLVNPSVHI